MSASQLFSSITSEATLEAFRAERREEDLYLEFKAKEDRRDGVVSGGDRRRFSEALSAFANGDGGVLVFGVETSRGASDVDFASGLKPITGHEMFRSRLSDLVLNTTHPSVDGVVLECLPSLASPGAGFVKCLIPASDRPPHRAVHAEREYWRRLSTGTRRMEHYELEDMFGRRLRPVLGLSLLLKPRDSDPGAEELHCFISNEGRGSARHTGFLCKLPGDCSVVAARGALSNVSGINEGRPTIMFYDSQGVVHANGIDLAPGYAVLRRAGAGQPLELEVALYADNARTQRVSMPVASGKKVRVI